MEELGFSCVPPCKTSMKFLENSGRWTVFALTETARLPVVVDWLKDQFTPTSVQVSPGIAPRVVRVELDRLPEKLARLLTTNRVQNVCLFSEGIATVLFQDAHDASNTLPPKARREPAEEPVVKPQSLKRLQIQGTKTVSNRQNQALSLAVAMGYYQVPHHVGLREIADQMGMSLGAFSELIRRAEATVIRAQVNHTLEADWEEVKTQVESMRR